MTQHPDLERLAHAIGVGIGDLAFGITFGNGDVWALQALSLEAAMNGDITQFIASHKGVNIVWTFTPWQDGFWVTLALEGTHGLNCRSLTSLSLTFTSDPADDIGEWWVPNAGKSVHGVGMFKVNELTEHTRTDTRLRGAFKDSHTPGLFLGTRIPQTHEHDYAITCQDNTLQIHCTTWLSVGMAANTTVVSEATWVCANKCALVAQKTYATHLPYKPVDVADIPTGWNSWDYYASSVGLDDMLENMDAIQRDPWLAARTTYIVVDMGWEHMLGEWWPNHRFPGGLERLVSEIRVRGFVPGIWTAPTIVQNPSRTAQRHYDMLLKNDYGDPILSEHFPNSHVLDPTHPAGEAFLRELFTRLYQTGFRLFKTDYAYEFSAKHNFYRADYGCYDVWRHLYRLIRDCVGSESHILGCGLPPECGIGLVESSRIGVDIHNHWSHVEWVCDYLQLAFWQQGRIAINDPDFLIVRGRDTSHEAITNMLNTNAHDPNYRGRWRHGADFTLAEAQTWASLVMAAGGSLFLGDRMSQLNETGRRLIEKAYVPIGVAARPLDWCQQRRATLWLQTLAHEYRLTVINWADASVTQVIQFESLGLLAPSHVVEIWSAQSMHVQEGRCAIELQPHASMVLTWGR